MANSSSTYVGLISTSLKLADIFFQRHIFSSLFLNRDVTFLVFLTSSFTHILISINIVLSALFGKSIIMGFYIFVLYFTVMCLILRVIY